MKITKLNALFLFILAVTFETSAYAANISVIPALPTTNDYIVANIAGEHFTSGYTLDSYQLFFDSANSINIDLFIDAPAGIVLMVMTPFSYDIDIGSLVAGTYSISADFYFDGIFRNTVNNTFSVSSVPEPAAGWLLFSGILAIFSFAMFNKKNAYLGKGTMLKRSAV
jgi:hypothetical protein